MEVTENPVRQVKLLLCITGREKLPMLDEGSFAVPYYSLLKRLSVYPSYPSDISWEHTQHPVCYKYCYAMNVRPLEI